MKKPSFKKQLVGTWTISLCELVQSDGTKNPLVVGDDPIGQIMFTDNGHFAFQVSAKLPMFGSENRMKATPEENKAVVEGSIAYFGSTRFEMRMVQLRFKSSAVHFRT
jgi:hypothetical protein